MPITPETCDRLTAGVARIVRSGRQLSARAADTVDGDLPSSGWALPAPLARSGHVDRRPDPREGRAALIRLTGAGASALAGIRALRTQWAAGALVDRDEPDGRRLGDLLDRLASDLDRSAVPTSHRVAS